MPPLVPLSNTVVEPFQSRIRCLVPLQIGMEFLKPTTHPTHRFLTSLLRPLLQFMFGKRRSGRWL